MKFNKWTVALVAVGLVNLSSAVQAEESNNSIITALSSTTLSGYVDTSAQWNIGKGNAFTPPYSFGGTSKADGFNLNVVKLSLAKDPDASEPWSAGYKVDLLFGPDASALNTVSPVGGSSTAFPTRDVAVKQAYVALRAPVGNGLDFKIGVWDTVLGYEVFESGNNPNFTRSYGYTIEPTTHTGVQMAYKFNDMLSACLCVANTFGPSINGRANPPRAESYKTYMSSITFTAPQNWGWLAGSTLSGSVINGYNTGVGDSQTSYYVGTTINTPVTGLKFGVAFDYFDQHNLRDRDEVASNDGTAWVVGVYGNYQATEKLSFNLRGEYFEDNADLFEEDDIRTGFAARIYEATATVQYDLWKNVISRLEFRWDHSQDKFFGAANSAGFPNNKNAFMVAANIIYKF